MVDKLKISSIAESGNAAETFQAMLNPESLSHEVGINYTDDSCKNRQPQGNNGKKVELSGYQSETLKFDILMDATGVVEQKKAKSIAQQLKSLKKVTYDYRGSQHEPNKVKIFWGTLTFQGRLSSMSVSYTLFNSSGTPLRAKVSLSFKGYLSEEEKEAEAKKSSPDLTHLVEFKAGDTLPQLCEKIYRDSRYYPDVARVNHLASVRHIRPGTRLYFPPLVK
ncbi:CIS tube protein [Vibrio quintilis]|uniref:Contractile injection system tube protein N-terminal domain-containing protein n=1 Tax=Vibrio quintilis TaxID=1117707 RepID=A0A1M7YQ53_9VIBR|nr:peptidoglycan-binding protein [Vibrio quintilis]SHO54748.1 hypothetical protein VQ7734_00466 [Vibrio quintilis]